MSFSFNHVQLGGNLTRDPELRMFAGDRAVAGCSLAVNRRWKDRDGNQHEAVSFIDLELWGKTAELLQQYCRKGDPILVHGRLQQDSWEDKEGNKRNKLKVVVEQLVFLPRRGAASDGSATAASPAEAGPTTTRSPEFAGTPDDEPPF